MQQERSFLQGRGENIETEQDEGQDDKQLLSELGVTYSHRNKVNIPFSFGFSKL